MNADLPITSSNRIHELDIWRGFAILGIFMVNILVMNVSFAYRVEWEAEQIGWLQEASFFVLETFFFSKFFAIFSFLFGLGVALQIDRAKQKGSFSNAFFVRRFGSLFIFGILHILLLWAGDILHLYGMLGFLLLLFFRLPPKAVLWSSVLIFAFPLYSEIFDQLMIWLEIDHASHLAALSRAEILDFKHNGSYWSGVILRIKEYGFAMALIYAGITPIAFAMMLLGGYLVKSGLLANMPALLKKVKMPLLISLIILLVYRFSLLYLLIPNVELEHGTALSIALFTIYQLSDISISLSMLWILSWLWINGYFKRGLFQLSYVGRTAFSNYILQSLLGYWIMRTFNGYEFFSPFQCILVVLFIYVLQIILSKWWLKHFHFGPLEWLWRCISYWRLLGNR